ncbi:MAG: energy transducer TonB [Pseudobdellovibrionaceae bacterium]
MEVFRKFKEFSKKNLVVFIVASLLFHLFSFSTFLKVGDWLPKTEKREIITVEYVSELPPSPTELDQKIEKLKQKVAKLKKQVVEQEDRVNDETPDDSRFLSKHNQTVKNQTVAKNHGQFQNSANKEAQRKGSAFTNHDAERQKSQEAKQKGGSEAFTANGLPTLKALVPGVDWKQAAEKSREKIERSGLEESTSSTQAAVSQTRDHIEDASSGLETLLSTREFVYYSYYNRIRNQLAQYWEPKVKDKMVHIFKQGRSIASSENRVTQVIVVLDPMGILVGVQVIGESGVRELDDAAIEAFRAAGPFPNPPKGIVEQDGKIKIRWDFVIEA